MKTARFVVVPALTVLMLFFDSLPVYSVESGTGSMLLFKNAQTELVRAIGSDPENGHLFLGSDDGSLQVWQTSTMNLVQRIQVGNNPLMTVTPGTGGTVAVVERKNEGGYRISLWEWETGKERFVRDLAELPIWLAISPRGSFIAMSLPRMDSLAFFDGRTGAPLPWLRQNTGIVDYGLISSKEERIMTYHASTGAITYWDIQSGKIVAQFAARPGLRQFQILPDGTRTKAVAIDTGSIAIVDLLSGKTILSTTSALEPQWVLTDMFVPNQVKIVNEANNVLRIQTYAIGDTGFTESGMQRFSTSTLTGNLVSHMGSIYLGDSAGTTWRVLPENERATPEATRKPLAEKRVVPVSGIAFSHDALYVSLPTGMVRIDSSLFAENTPTEVRSFTVRPVPNGIANAGMAKLPDESLLLWEKGRNPKFYRFDTVTGLIVRTSPALPSSIVKVSTSGNVVVTVESNGSVRLWNLADFKQLFTYSALGSLSATYQDDGSLLIGKGASGLFESSLMRVTQKTGETIAIPNSETAVYSMARDNFDGATYYISIEKSSRDTITSLKRINGINPALVTQLIMSFPGEDLEGGIAFAQDRLQVFTTAGKNAVYAWDGRRTWMLEESPRLPRQLASSEHTLASINQEGSISLWSIANSKHQFDIIVLDTGAVLALDKSMGYLVLDRSVSGTSVPQPIAADLMLAESLIDVSAELKNRGVLRGNRLALPFGLKP